jgi:hypothetical protein
MVSNNARDSDVTSPQRTGPRDSSTSRHQYSNALWSVTASEANCFV